MASGKCNNPSKPDGTPCSTGQCEAGQCTAVSGSSSSGSDEGSSGASSGSGGSGTGKSGGCRFGAGGEPGAGAFWLGLGLLLAARRRKA
jgi:MYXO-CTERM domain-containing protein